MFVCSCVRVFGGGVRGFVGARHIGLHRGDAGQWLQLPMMMAITLTMGLVLQPAIPASRSYLRSRAGQHLRPQFRQPIVGAHGLHPAANGPVFGRAGNLVAVDSKRVRGAVVRRLHPPPPRPVTNILSEDAVSRVLELVWRDSRMLLRTALQRPLPVVHELVADRLPLASWFVRYHLDLGMRRHSEALERSPLYRQLFPDAARSLPRELEQIERRLAVSRSKLWPTIRTLLLRPSTHARIVQAARRQISHATRLESSRERVMRTPLRMLLLWAGLVRSMDYGLKWALVEVARRGSLLSASRQQRWRSRLIDRGLAYGVLIVRRMESVEETAPWHRAPTSARSAVGDATAGRARIPLLRLWRSRVEPGGAAALTSGIRAVNQIDGAVLPRSARSAGTHAWGRAGWLLGGVVGAWRRLARFTLRDFGFMWSTAVLSRHV